MEYTIRISRDNKPAIGIKVEADNVADALQNNLPLHPDFQVLDDGPVREVVVEFDFKAIPFDAMGIRRLDNGECQVEFDDYDPKVFYNEEDFLSTVRVVSKDSETLDPNDDKVKELIHYAADFAYDMGFLMPNPKSESEEL